MKPRISHLNLSNGEALVGNNLSVSRESLTYFKGRELILSLDLTLKGRLHEDSLLVQIAGGK